YQAGQTLDIRIVATDRQGGIGPTRLYQNGRLVPNDAIVAQNNGTQNNAAFGATTFRVQLAPGQNSFEAVSANDQGAEGPPAALAIAASGQRQQPNLHLVTIGINKYRDARLDLDYGAVDARAMLAALDRAGPLFRRIIDYRLMDDAATRQNILQLLN